MSDQVEFDAVWAEHYDRTLPAGVLAGEPAEVAFLRELAGAGEALEIGIGTGRIGLPLARAGVRVTGVEVSPAMAEALEAKEGGGDLRVLVGDFLTVDLDHEYVLVYATFATLLHFTSQPAQLACFHRARGALAAGGRFVVSAPVPDFSNFVNGTRTQVVRDDRGALVLTVLETLAPGSQLVTTELLMADGPATTAPLRIVQRWCWPEEIDLLAARAGFTLQERWSGWDRSPYDPAGGQHVSVYSAGS